MPYTTGPAVRPDGLALAAGATLLAISAIWLAAPSFLAGPPPNDFIGVAIDAPPPPPPPPPKDQVQPKPREAAPRSRAPTAVKPTIDLPKEPTEIALVPAKAEPVELLPSSGSGTGTGGMGATVEVTPPKPPVLVPPVIDPRYAGGFQPDYPAGEIRQGRDGVVIVRVLIGVDGRVKALEPVSATSEDFLAATRRRALDRWRFKPATRDGVAYEEWKQMRVTFTLKDE